MIQQNGELWTWGYMVYTTNVSILNVKYIVVTFLIVICLLWLCAAKKKILMKLWANIFMHLCVWGGVGVQQNGVWQDAICPKYAMLILIDSIIIGLGGLPVVLFLLLRSVQMYRRTQY